jgi:hypothetical protein
MKQNAMSLMAKRHISNATSSKVVVEWHTLNNEHNTLDVWVVAHTSDVGVHVEHGYE